MSNDGIRFDYVKATWALEYDRAQELGQEWYGVFGTEQADGSGRKAANVRSVGNRPGGKFLYVFEAWGVAAQQVYNLSFTRWQSHLERIDIRANEQVTRAGIDYLYAHLREHKAGNKNIHLFDSKANSKRNGRSTGGYGIAIGSHKSDLRTSFYVRGTEYGACEFQTQGKKLRDRIDIANIMYGKGETPDNEKAWTSLKYSIYANGWTDTRTVFGLDQQQIIDMAKGIQMPNDTTERKLELIDKLIDQLDKDGLASVLESVQMRLF